MSMFYNRLFWPVIEQPVFQASSSMKYTEDNDVITYTITVPENVYEGAIQASVIDGVMTIVMPKVVEKPANGEIRINRVG
jgi:HSP20 family molecular chaperone IbpA